MSAFLRAFHPNVHLTNRATQVLIIAWVVLLVLTWRLYPSALIPGPVEVLAAMGSVWSDGLLHELAISLKTYVEAMLIMGVLSMLLAYGSVVPVMRPPVVMITKMRFMGLAGLTFLFTLMIGGGHWLKVALLVFGMAVFTLDAMAKMVSSVTREQYDHARTLRMGEWRVVWEVVVCGRADQMMEIIRQNAAMGWMMLPMVEGLVRSEGGVGAMLLAQTKHFHLAEVFAVQIIILLLGLGQDWLIGTIRAVVFPWADLKVERR